MKYSNEFFIFSSNIVQYFCHDFQCEIFHSTHCDQIIFFDRDRRKKSQIYEKIFVKIWCLIFNNAQIHSRFDFYEQIFNEYLIIEKSFQKILIFNVIVRRADVVFLRNQIFNIKFVINYVFNEIRQMLKFNNLFDSIRKKFEFKIFHKNNLNQILNQQILLFSLFIFIDNFDFNRNVYHFITNIYAMSIFFECFSKTKKQKCVDDCFEFSWNKIQRYCELFSN